MSFSSDLKMELSQINNLKNKQEVYAEFLGYLASNNIDVKGRNVKFSTESEYNINRFAKLLNNLEIKDYKINITGKTYSITYKCDEIPVLEDAENYLQQDNLKKAYIRGNFLGAGSINNPRNKYHLEIIFKDKECAEFTLKLLNEYSIGAKILEKTVYLKDGEEISSFLALMGANKSVIKFEEIRVMKETRNNINRLVNCETANLNKIIDASIKQVNAIKKLKKEKKFENLPENLKELANLRVQNPEASYQELGGMLKEPIGKSGVSHRLEKIIKIAEE